MGGFLAQAGEVFWGSNSSMLHCLIRDAWCKYCPGYDAPGLGTFSALQETPFPSCEIAVDTNAFDRGGYFTTDTVA